MGRTFYQLNLTCLAGILVLISGCSALDEQYHRMTETRATWDTSAGEPVVVPPKGTGLAYQPDTRDLTLPENEPVATRFQDPLQTGFYARQTHKSLNEYADQLAMQLMRTATGLQPQATIGIASFVRLSHSLQDTTVLGNQLAEYLMGQLQDYGMGVVDYKLTRFIQITKRGDIIMSRKVRQLAADASMAHVLTGTMIETPRGVRVNARIISLDDQRMVASASLDIPAFIVTSLNPVTAMAH
ncbi:FlgO family outer membrane protein [Salinimonas lutimaris]|uniref:FlgO family outer membrane protein n=1 Tax=Salinimonas lutimaris TaxID=914153 RepID=UPI0010C04083|nr:FlgO family outer membrane protein [Salinimonas lutimaris]